MMKNAAKQPIGIFDSGVGGLTVVRQIHRRLPQEDLVYLGDTARVPYGTKSPGTVIRFALEDSWFLQQRGVKAVVVACNTASAWALPTLQRRLSMPVLGVIQPGAETAYRRTRNRRIGIIGTSATIRSGAYCQAIAALDAAVSVWGQICPLLVPLVEEGWMRHAVTTRVLQEYLKPLLRRRIDTLVLGCTHYPLLKGPIRQVAGRGVRLVDSAESCAQYVARELADHRLLAPRRRRSGVVLPYVTDESARFDELAQRFLRFRSRAAEQVELPFLSLTAVD